MSVRLTSTSKETNTMADDTKRCAHPGCNCPPDDDEKYCSAYCEGAGDTADINCRCGCPTCA
ncbi:MAG TPA: hypothetical protein VFX96_10130 [Pyrinomonadaceae bacterium]|nr:hypothetical protein [Pyrinomonadaceae bacterium]